LAYALSHQAAASYMLGGKHGGLLMFVTYTVTRDGVKETFPPRAVVIGDMVKMMRYAAQGTRTYNVEARLSIYA